MFSGLVEFNTAVVAIDSGDHCIHLKVARPSQFPSDLSIGDSIALNGICLTLESFDSKHLSFTIGHETLQLSGWSEADLPVGREFHLEPSLRLSDRIHGHIVTGHVDGFGEVQEVKPMGDCLVIRFAIPEGLGPMIWAKGSIAINGISLTINDVDLGNFFEVCLIPETLKKTLLGGLKVGNKVCLEMDSVARGIVHIMQNYPRL